MLCLRRTLKVATHETGHMFSIHHCIAYDCNMNGSNSLIEADGQPLWLCPQCMAKVSWAAKVDPTTRFRNLQAFCEKHELTDEAAYFDKAIEKLNAVD